jgi:hypothetical protein
MYQASPNKILRYELKPNIKTTYLGYEIVINSDGFRGKEYPIQKAKNVHRIVIVGDSVALARMIPLEHSFAYKLQESLDRLCPDKRFEVLNMAVEGYNSIQELEALKTKGLKYNPDLVIVYYCLNDPDYPEYYFQKNFINRHSILARYILYKSKKHRVKKDRRLKGITSIQDNYRYLYTTECWQHAKEAVLEMADVTAAKGIKMILLIAPEMSEAVKDFRQGYPFWYINETLEAIAHPNIVIIDPIREFSRINLNKAESVVGTYPNYRANDIIVDYTLKKLQENNIRFCD